MHVRFLTPESRKAVISASGMPAAKAEAAHGDHLAVFDDAYQRLDGTCIDFIHTSNPSHLQISGVRHFRAICHPLRDPRSIQINNLQLQKWPFLNFSVVPIRD
jgi:hypothetical protein